MKISRLVSWTGPAYVGTVASSWAAAAAYVAVAKPALVLGSQLFTWLFYAAIATPIAGRTARPRTTMATRTREGTTATTTPTARICVCV